MVNDGFQSNLCYRNASQAVTVNRYERHTRMSDVFCFLLTLAVGYISTLFNALRFVCEETEENKILLKTL